MTNAFLPAHSSAEETPRSAAIRAVPATEKTGTRPVKSKVIIVPYYPPVLMPEQPSGYLKPRKYDFF